ncbi:MULTISPECIES: hypothetical protein [Acinetobacter]|jgi:hypothetical protein|uniref:Uncharacterized protein n=4 Tax=Acinetobacter TaxID=469 RepID=A0A0A8TPL4_ACIBZ|nr:MULTISPECIES: hypothetical protein [Acinetobacter]MEC8125706.1 hypothetical protein [Pseudomonadota bacterium]ATZ63509.1 hypothetical protein BSR55_09210 [Acinetobacter bereziniae]ELW79064.1 hypothetical protein ACINWC743_2480 [Acinetobacter sp. WC-743]ENV21371.1 hypothetical protein F963_02512 [Acinetobacter bereziniae NIPH 3]ENW00419.1 hypothetical protein F938_00620 [Acinetobacter bereziniae LMG 1003 = CIP 70.12]
MEVVAYLHNADLLLEDEQGVAVISGSHYVLSLGDQVFFQDLIDEQAKLYQVKISFACADHVMLHEDEVQMKFEGCRTEFQKYTNSTTVH